MTIIVFLLTLLITVAIEAKLIPVLKYRAAQPIYEEGPSWHLKKSGTPTMGGIGFLIAITISLLLFLILSRDSSITKLSILISLLFSIGNCFIGIIDDLTKLRKKENAGLKAYEKIIFQIILAVIFLMARKYFLGDETVLEFRFGSFDFGILYYILAVFIILGTVNCANLTDGIDGLASSVALTIGICCSILFAMQKSSISALSAAIMGGTLGFLFFNRHPAKIFMGDTGSLFLGALAVSIAFSFGNPTIILFLGIVYAIEGLSVIMQVAYYKVAKKRLFKMAPLHHHLEKSGLSENKICLIAVIITMLFSILASFVYKL